MEIIKEEIGPDGKKRILAKYTEEEKAKMQEIVEEHDKKVNKILENKPRLKFKYQGK